MITDARAAATGPGGHVGAATGSSAAGLHPSAVWHVLRRLGISYKRAEPWLHSPDPDYFKKNARSRLSCRKRGKTRKP